MGDWFLFDLGLACQSLCLMAHNLGLGTVILGFSTMIKPTGALGVKEGYQLVSVIPLGYPAKDGRCAKAA